MKKKIFNNWQWKLGALIFAILFWRVIGEIADPVTTLTFRNVPVTIVNEEIVTDTGKVYQVEDNVTTVTVVVKAETSILRQITVEDIIATADFEEIILAELVPVTVEIRGFEGRYQEATVTPVNLNINIEDSTSKKFPIIASSFGTMNEEYALGEMVVQTETVTISGPESIIETIARVEAQVNITEITEDTTLTANLICYDANNLAIDQTLLTFNLGSDMEMKVDVEVLDTKYVSLEFETSGAPADGYELSELTAEPTEILVAGKSEVLDELETIEIPGSALDITGLSGKVELLVDVTEYLPEDIQLYDANNNSIAVTLQIDELGTKSVEIPVQSIIVYDNPDDLTLSYDGITDIMLTFSGLDDVLEDLNSSMINLSINLISYKEAGEYDVPVIVTVSNVSGCELVEEVTVPIVLSEK